MDCKKVNPTPFRLLGEAVYPLKDLVRLGAQEATVPLRDSQGKIGEVTVLSIPYLFRIYSLSISISYLLVREF